MAKANPLSQEALSHLKSYKYSSVDKSFLSNYVLRHFWNASVELLPMWLAPNMVTLLGFCCVIINVFFIWVFIPDLIGPGPSWVYYSSALGLWMYQTLDNLDGKQARRTGTSSPLGELFDHGIDSLNCTLASLCETAAVGLGSTKTGAFTALIPCLPMFFSTWETYHTHTLYLGRFNGPTEGLLIACTMIAISGYYGPGIWTFKLADLVGQPELFGDLSFRDLWVPMLLFTFFAAHLPACILNVIRARRQAGLPIMPVFLDWTPMLVYCVACAVWLGSPSSSLLKDNHLILFCLTMSFVFGRLTTKIILHHLTRQSFPYWTVMLLPLVGGAILTNLPQFGFAPISPVFEAWYLRGYFLFAFSAYMRWALLVIEKICSFLDINCLTIREKNQDREEIHSFEVGTKDSNGSIRASKKKL